MSSLSTLPYKPSCEDTPPLIGAPPKDPGPLLHGRWEIKGEFLLYNFAATTLEACSIPPSTARSQSSSNTSTFIFVKPPQTPLLSSTKKRAKGCFCSTKCSLTIGLNGVSALLLWLYIPVEGRSSNPKCLANLLY